MKSIFVTGANGQLGSALQQRANHHPEWTFYFTDIDALDICDKAQLTEYVRANGIGYILNCAAYTAVDKAEDDAERCMRINRDAVRNISEVASEHGAHVIHISTDYVFDGRGQRPYREDDPTAPTSVYGRTKLAGEQALQEVLPDAVIIRTAWLYSEVGQNFVKTMLRLGAERSEVSVVADQVGTPTYAGDLADAMLKILAHPVWAPGIYHFSNEGVCSWYDFARKIMEIGGRRCTLHPITTDQYPTRATRPAYSVLDKTKIKQVFGLRIPAWEESLAGCVHTLTANI